MKGQSEMKIGASLSRTRKSKTSRIPLIVYGWLFLVTVLAGILFYVSIYYTKVQLIKGKPLTGLARDYQSTANGLRSGQQGSDGVGKDSRKETLVVSTLGHGDIHIVLRPDLSQESVAYIREMAKLHSCPICNFYRADERILQGIIKSDNFKKVEKKGKCPLAYQGKSQPNCPAWDPDCGCHGPTMTKGMVGWAGGGTGQDFFIASYDKPAVWWGQQHTVWGEIQDSKSQEVVDAIFKLPTHKKEMVYLNDKIPFQIRII